MEDEELTKGRAVWEMTRTKGWDVIEEWLKEQSDYHKHQLAQIDLRGKSDSEVVAQYLNHRETMKAYEKVLNKVEELKTSKN